MFQISSPLSAPGISGRPLSIKLYPASGGKRVPQGRGRSQAGPRSNFQNAATKYTCDDYFHKEADSQLGGGNRYTGSIDISPAGCHFVMFNISTY
ncbi:uncharacterized protein TNCV_2394901 [Trichonephila clavipes]|nr:uncharacterized protein TNCV_2394901 [Trichonephila clavipes]